MLSRNPALIAAFLIAAVSSAACCAQTLSAPVPAAGPAASTVTLPSGPPAQIGPAVAVRADSAPITGEPPTRQQAEQIPLKNNRRIGVQRLLMLAQAYVLALDATNHVECRNLTLDIQTANRGEITSGLTAGDLVIASDQTNHQSGEAVSPHAAFIPPEAQEVSD